MLHRVKNFSLFGYWGTTPAFLTIFLDTSTKRTGYFFRSGRIWGFSKLLAASNMRHCHLRDRLLMDRLIDTLDRGQGLQDFGALVCHSKRLKLSRTMLVELFFWNLRVSWMLALSVISLLEKPIQSEYFGLKRLHANPQMLFLVLGWVKLFSFETWRLQIVLKTVGKSILDPFAMHNFLVSIKEQFRLFLKFLLNFS